MRSFTASIDREGYTVEKVHFESAPGFFVTGNLYRPKNIQGKAAGRAVRARAPERMRVSM